MSEIIELSQDELKNLRLIELEMLVELDRICKKNNIKYSLDGGTLLGAIRHKGFIPWDDDLDVTFKHEEYEKFYNACKTDLDTSRFFFQDYRTDKKYRWGYGKLRRLNTEYIKKNQEHLKQRTGVCIDIFDYQNLPDDEKTKKKYRKKMFVLRKIMYSGVGRFAEKSVFMRILYSILYLIPIQWIQKIRYNEVNKYTSLKSEKVSNEMFLTPRTKNGIDGSVYDDFIEVEFEGMKFSGFKKFDLYLKTLYGDYMKLPPVEKQVGVMNAVKMKLLDVRYEDIVNQYNSSH